MGRDQDNGDHAVAVDGDRDIACGIDCVCVRMCETADTSNGLIGFFKGNIVA